MIVRRAVLFLLLALPLAAQTQRVVSRIEVRGGVPAAIILSQSALEEGGRYSDDDLDAAIARLRRLPFVHDARYTLDGETLILEVDGTTPVFFDVQADAGTLELNTNRAAVASGGGRVFLGSGGVAVGSVSKLLHTSGDTASRAQVGYAHYAIGGTRLFAIADAEAVLTWSEGSRPNPAWRLTVGYPLTLRQTISATADHSGFRSRRTILGEDFDSRLDQTSLSLRWAYDTTDDPLFTRRGSLVSATPSWAWQESRFATTIFPFPNDTPSVHLRRSEGTTAAFSAEARRYWAHGARGSIFAGVDGRREEQEFDVRIDNGPPMPSAADSDVVRLSLGYGYNFFDRNAPTADARHRLELGAGFQRRHAEFGTGSFDDDETSVTAGYVFRKPFGTVRVSMGYEFN
ncbi:MAG TPA: hypothetical protein VGF28_25695 [Thermoanaerobaculia bacterium]